MKTDEKSTLYLCNPRKNTECQKGICQIPNGCFLTTRKEFAVTDENENPIIAIGLRQKQLSHAPSYHARAGNITKRK